VKPLFFFSKTESEKYHAHLFLHRPRTSNCSNEIPGRTLEIYGEYVYGWLGGRGKMHEIDGDFLSGLDGWNAKPGGLNILADLVQYRSGVFIFPLVCPSGGQRITGKQASRVGGLCKG
jgi:hypothetical protein